MITKAVWTLSSCVVFKCYYLCRPVFFFSEMRLHSFPQSSRCGVPSIIHTNGEKQCRTFSKKADHQKITQKIFQHSHLYKGLSAVPGIHNCRIKNNNKNQSCSEENKKPYNFALSALCSPCSLLWGRNARMFLTSQGFQLKALQAYFLNISNLCLVRQ